jgi:hypothetical protein
MMMTRVVPSIIWQFQLFPAIGTFHDELFLSLKISQGRTRPHMPPHATRHYLIEFELGSIRFQAMAHYIILSARVKSIMAGDSWKIGLSLTGPPGPVKQKKRGLSAPKFVNDLLLSIQHLPFSGVSLPLLVNFHVTRRKPPMVLLPALQTIPYEWQGSLGIFKNIW